MTSMTIVGSSLDIPLHLGRSHLGRMGTDELVPSRYALQVGEIDVLVISDGVLPLPAATLATNANPAELAAWLDDMRQPPDVFKWPLNVVVLRSGGRTVLVDAGIGAEIPANFPRAAGLLAGRLEAAGINPSSVTDVVLTHMHVDHVGGLLADELGARCVRMCRSTWRPPRSSSGRRPISPATLLRGCRTCFGQPPGASRTSTAANCGRSSRSTKWRRG